MDQKRTDKITSGRPTAQLQRPASGSGGPAGRSGNGTAKAAAKPKGNKRISSGLVALSSAAIFAVYGFGFVQTQASSNQLAAQSAPTTSLTSLTQSVPSTPNAGSGVIPTVPPTVVVSSTAAQSASQPTTLPPTAAPPTAAPPTAVPSPTAVAQKYKDGTFVGQGYSRHGGVVASVVIQAGKIVSANVQSCSTRFPCSAVDQLPPLVVQTQAPPVDYVSGATDSSMAYQQAVTSALAQAQGQGNG